MNGELTLTDAQVAELEDIYEALQQEYEAVAEELVFSCTGCPDNCCDSYFLHHTYVEWAYLWLGLHQLAPDRLEQLQARASQYIVACERADLRGERPAAMCPLNEDGICSLYRHRLLVCRTHGVPAKMTRPDGKALHFPGCFRCQELVAEKGSSSEVNRTPWLARLVDLENSLLDNKRHLLPKVRLTIAQMIVKGPPPLPPQHCRQPGR
jgi:hypothetical protein